MTDTEEADPNYGYCNSCGEEMWIGEECCDDGEWELYDQEEEEQVTEAEICYANSIMAGRGIVAEKDEES